jgi:hypothetical protein
MKVLELIPGKRVRWQCVDGAEEWIGTELTFELKEKDGATILLFAQRGWKEQVEFMHYCCTNGLTIPFASKTCAKEATERPTRTTLTSVEGHRGLRDGKWRR